MDAKTFQTKVVASSRNLELMATQPAFVEQFQTAVEGILAAYRKGGALFVAGNGGSAADAQHIVAELVSKLERDRTPIRAFALTVDTSILTAIGNDYGFEYAFERQVRGLMRPEDIFLAISTSGNSKNILFALRAAREMGIRTILLTGRDGGIAGRGNLADLVITAPGTTTAMIQEAHILTYHLLCEAIEEGMVSAGLCHYR